MRGCHKQMLTESSGEVTLYSLSNFLWRLFFPSVIYSNSYSEEKFSFSNAIADKTEFAFVWLYQCAADLLTPKDTSCASSNSQPLVSFDRPCPSATPPRCLLHLLCASAPWGLRWLKIETPILRRDAISFRRVWRSRRNSQRDSFGALYTLLSAGMWLLFDRESINKVFSFGRWVGGIWRLTNCVFLEWAAFCWSELSRDTTDPRGFYKTCTG